MFCLHVSVQHKCVVPMTTRRGCRISWNCNYRNEPSFGSWEIKLDPWEGKPMPKTTRPSLHCLKLQFYETKIIKQLAEDIEKQIWINGMSILTQFLSIVRMWFVLAGFPAQWQKFLWITTQSWNIYFVSWLWRILIQVREVIKIVW